MRKLRDISAFTQLRFTCRFELIDSSKTPKKENQCAYYLINIHIM